MTQLLLWKHHHKKKRLMRSAAGNISFTLIVFLTGLFMVFPLIYATVNAFKPINELFLFPPRFFVKHPTLDNFAAVSELLSNLSVPITRYIFNSFFISTLGTILCVIVSSLCAYPLAKHHFKGRLLILQVVIWAILFRPEVTGMAQYVVIAKLGMIDTYWAILLPSLSGSFGVFLLKQFMENTPDSVLESARLDGAHEINIYWSIVMPIMKPAWITLMIFTFTGLWNATGVNYIYTESKRMLPAALSQISAGGIARAGAGSAIAFLLMLPPIILFIFTQNKIVETMAHSGIK